MSKVSDLSFRLEFQNRVVFEMRAVEMPPEILIGRAAACDWKVPPDCKSVSGSHVKLIRSGAHVLVRDLESRNGVYCDGKRISQQKMSVGDVYSIGECKLVVERDETPSAKEMEKFHVLEQLSGVGRGKTIQLDKCVMRIGSGSDCEIRIDDLVVSNVHAVLEVKPDGACWIKDCGSRNGTKVNGETLADDALETGRMLQDGDIVSVAYVDYRFLDRRVVHVRSHFLWTVAVVLITLSIAVGGYFAYTLVSPSAKDMRILAEQYAAHEDFAGAEAQLKLASESRGHASDAERRLELVQNVKTWADTFETWNRIKESLAKGGGNLKDLNVQFGTLVSANNDNWKWNATSAVAEMKNAQTTQSLLGALLEAEEAFTAVEPDVARLRKLLAKIERTLSGQSKSPQPYQSAIVSRLSSLQAEIASVLGEYDALLRGMKSYSSVDMADSVLEELDRIAAANRKRNAERQKNSLPVSALVSEQVKIFRAPVLALRDSFRILKSNYSAVARWSFAEFSPELPLPSAEQCISFPNLATRREELLAANEMLPGIIAQLKNFGFQFENLGMKPDSMPPACERLFDAERLKSVFACDSLGMPMPGYADPKASGVYDETVGVYVFFSYLNSLDGDFDSTIIDERFRPLLFQVPEVFALLESYLDFCYGKKDARLSAVMAEVRASVSDEEGNKVLAWANCAEKANARRTAFVRQLLRTFMSDKTRRGVIAGGMVCHLRGRGCGFVPEDIKVQVNERFRSLRREVGKLVLLGGDRAPEEQLKAERQALEVGIPGDVYLKQAWVERSRNSTGGASK